MRFRCAELARSTELNRSHVELPRQPLGVAGGADGAVEVEGFAQRPVGRRRVAERRRQAAAQLQDSRRQRPTLIDATRCSARSRADSISAPGTTESVASKAAASASCASASL